jgi:acylphosphatase
MIVSDDDLKTSRLQNMGTDARLTIHLRTEGRVQGVGYRAFVEVNAAELSIVGWVRNRNDGSVEAVFQGNPDNVAKMIDRCRQGPPAAVVTNVTVRSEDVGVLLRFTVRPTV